ncbi:hypothetical protein Pmar_PMAR006660, partial [Perkinsus marinus ATCC 50983]
MPLLPTAVKVQEYTPVMYITER